MQQSQWKDHIQWIYQELGRNPSPFVHQFLWYFSKAIQEFFPSPGEPTHPFTQPLDRRSLALSPIQKAFIHALQLYTLEDTTKLISNYDPEQQGEDGFFSIVRKSAHSLSVIPFLEKVALTYGEGEALQIYCRKLEKTISVFLNCSKEAIYQKPQLHQCLQNYREQHPGTKHVMGFYEARLNLLFSSTYCTYLILRNRYFISKIIYCTNESEIEQWVRKGLSSQYPPAMNRPLDASLTLLNFRDMEALMKDLVRNFSQHPKLYEQLPSLSLLGRTDVKEDDQETPKQILPPVIYLMRSRGGTTSGVPLAREPEQGEYPAAVEAPLHPIVRSPFEELCFRYTKELLVLAKHTELITECSSPYYFPRSEEYVSTVVEGLHHFFGGSPLVFNDFSDFVSQVLEASAEDNPFEIRREPVQVYTKVENQWQASGTVLRNREWSAMLGSQLPFSLVLNDDENKTYVIEKGWHFVVQLGTACFDYDQAKHKKAHTKPSGFFKVLFYGRTLIPNSAIVYIGKSPYYTLTGRQLHRCRGLFMLYLIALRNKFSLEIPKFLKTYLVQSLPTSLNELVTDAE